MAWAATTDLGPGYSVPSVRLNATDPGSCLSVFYEDNQNVTILGFLTKFGDRQVMDQKGLNFGRIRISDGQADGQRKTGYN